jgi:8-oxo-dGTP pyrophosphatase MutT (NUDIX family)
MINGFEKLSVQSGVLPLAGDRVVLITARRSGRWIIPKGHVEKGMSPADSAAKEAWEEAGLTGRVHSQEIGTYSYSRLSGRYVVQVFPLEVDSVLEEWQEMHMRQRKLVTPSEAIEMLCNDELRSLIAGYFNNRIIL